MPHITPTPAAAAVIERGMTAILKTKPAELGMRDEPVSQVERILRYDGREWRARKTSYEISFRRGVEVFWRATDNSGECPHIDADTLMDLKLYIIFGDAYNAALREAKPQCP